MREMKSHQRRNVGAGDRNEAESDFPGCYSEGCCGVNWDGVCRGGDRHPGQKHLLGEQEMNELK